jgi:hypothetical protein
MTSETDRFWDEIAPKYRKLKGFRPMTAEEAEAAYAASPAVPIHPEVIQRIVEGVLAEEMWKWEPEVTEWLSRENLEAVENDVFAMYREEGEPAPETDARENELRKRMQDDEPLDEDGLDGGAASPGEGSKGS